MRLNTLQIAALLAAAIAVILTFLTAAATVLALPFAPVGASLLAWIVHGLAHAAPLRKGDLSHARHPAVPTSLA